MKSDFFWGNKWLALSIVALCAGCSADGTPFTKVDSIPDGKGVVYIYRPAHFTGSAVYGTLKANDVPITKVTNGGYFPYVAEPGMLHLSIATETTNSTDVDVEAGKETYVKSSVSIGLLVGHLTLTEVSPEIGAQEIHECKLLPPVTP